MSEIRTPSFACSFAMVCGFLLLASGAWAQVVSGSVTGTVRDTSGGVLPGVTVEAASPALIEKVRSAVTDAEGRYRIVDLRAGVYTVTFTLPGFATLRREGIQLNAGFTATVNAELSVGALEETITVTGAAPLVDTQNVRSQATIQREVLDSLPTTGRLGQLVTILPGASIGSAVHHDVGGVASDRSQMAMHGQNSGDLNLNVGGMDQRVRSGGSFSPNRHLYEQVTIETGGFSAQSETGGIQVNIINKDGGNSFSGSASGYFTSPDWVADNVTPELRARGLPEAPSVKKLREFGGAFGGPIIQNRLWFIGGANYLAREQYQAGNYFNRLQDSPGVDNDPVWRVILYEPDLSRPAFKDDRAQDYTLRLTTQAGNHRISAAYSQMPTCQCMYNLLESGLGGAVLRTPEATGQHHYNPQYLPIVTWTFPATNRLLLEAGASMNMYGGNSKRQEYGDGQRVSRDVIAVEDQGLNIRYGSRAENLGNLGGSYTALPIKIRQQMFTAAYITPSHNFKVGIDLTQNSVGPEAGTHLDANQINGARSYRFRNGVPNRVTIWATPFSFHETSRDIAFFAQDEWTVRRLTAHLGVRWNNFNGEADPVELPAGPWVPARSYPGLKDAPNWTNLDPRGGLAYDLFGDGRTAIKGSLGRYAARLRDSVQGPARLQIHNTSRTWNDRNRDYVPDCDLRNPEPNGECGAWNNLGFGQQRDTTLRFADDALGGFNLLDHNWQGSVQVQHELRAGIGVTVGYYRTWYGGFLATDNLAVEPGDFDEFCITAPVDPRLPTSGQQLCGLYDVRPEKFGLEDNLVTQASNYSARGEISRVYNGVDATFNARFGQGGMLGGGVSVGRTVEDNCLVVDSPQAAREGFCKVVPPFSSETDFKLMVVYPLLWGLQTSAIYQNIPGISIGASYVAPNAEVAPSLGRNLAGGEANVTVDLMPPNTLYEPRLQQLDVRLTRTFRAGGVRVRANFDLYNVFNASNILAVVGRYGPAWQQPLQVMGGRLFKLGAHVDF